MIQVKDLYYRFEEEDRPAVQDLSVEIPEGVHTAVIGPNGSGKTTFLRHLNGLLLPSRGDVLVDGLNTRHRRDIPEIRRRVGMVFQNPDNQIVGMTVEEDVAFGPGNLRLPPAEIRERVLEALETVGLQGFEKRSPHALSSGEKQLVALAGILAMKPRHVLLDEPTAYLDSAGRRRVMEVIRRLHRSGLTIVHVTHHMDDTLDADEILVMNRGRFVMKIHPADLVDRAEEIQGLGLDIPVVTRLMARLRESGMPVRRDIFTLDEAVRELSDRLRSGSPPLSPGAQEGRASLP